MASGASSGRVHDRIQLLLAQTANRRVRLQGLQDASLHFGWVSEFSGGIVVVDVSSKRGINPGDFLYLEVSAPSSLLTFVAYVTQAAGTKISLQISSEVEERSLKSESRVRIRTFDAKIGCPCNGSVTPVVVLDISENGFGFLSHSQVEVTGPCKMVLNSPQGDINLSGDVRHAHSDKDLAAYRGGVLIKYMDRVSRARWQRLLGE